MDPEMLMLQLQSSEESDIILSNLQKLQAFPVLNFLSVNENLKWNDFPKTPAEI